MAFTINHKPVLIPIIQGGMGIGISFSSLVSASLEAGIVGTLSSAQAGFKERDFKTDELKANLRAIKEEVQKVRARSPKGILGVNVMRATNGYEKYIHFIKNLDIDFIISGAGLPIELPKLLEGSTVAPAAIVSSAKAAKLIVKKWKKSFNVVPEFLVVEGPLAGGHLGFTKEAFSKGEVPTLKEICQEVLDVIRPLEEEYQVSIPIVAAGGIVDGHDMAPFLEMGCSAVQIATRLIATPECDCSPSYKQKIIDAKTPDIVFVPSPVGLPGRAIRNAFSDFVQENKIPVTSCHKCLSGCKVADIPYCITEKLSSAVLGDVTNGLVFSGGAADRVNRMQSVEEIVCEMMSEYKSEVEK